MLKRFTKEERGWIYYDWANSAFSAIVAAIVLPLFFAGQASTAFVAGGMTPAAANTHATALWGYATSLATLVCALLAPVLGALGDYPGYKKRLFTVFAAVGILGSLLLGFTGSWPLLLIFYIISNIGFNASCLYYDSFLNDVTTEDRMDLVSAYGYGLGYIGGSTIPLVVALIIIQFGDKIGISAEAAARISFVLTAVWWAVFTLPMLKNVRQRHSVPREQGNLMAQSFRRVGRTALDILRHKGVMWFLIAYFFYIDGVGTIIHMATIFGNAAGLESMSMMWVMMVVQLVAFPCAILYGILAKKIGGRNMILIGIGTYCVVCLVGLRLHTLTDFLLLGALVGTAQGGLQALSRSYFGKLVPDERSAEFFGFFDIFGKFSAVVGPALFGLVAQVTGVPHAGVVVVLALFLIGGGIFTFLVPKAQQSIR
ncbi:MAG: MFS transporter [Oscillospiraceae bacterium]|jgi:UMF1 family MFS transporter|nr:MFS transporter [Oscillospiraceae bacterium]